MPEIVFALARGQNHFFVEIVHALRGELDDLGVPARVTVGELPAPGPDVVPVLVPPHEFFALTPPEHHPAPPELRRAIFLCAEQPGTWFFGEDVRLTHLHGAALMDISDQGVRAFRDENLHAEHLAMGFSRHWGCREEQLAAERDIDVLHLGIWSLRRAEALARCAPALARRRSRIVLADPEGPNAAPAGNFVVDDDKWALMRRTRALLNIHVGDRRYFEWLRVAQAMSNGVAVVSEHSDGVLPLEPGVHFVSARVDALPIALDALLEDEPRRAAMARAAYALLRDELPLRLGAERLVAIAEERAALPLTPRRPLPRPAAAPAEPPARERFPSLIDDPEVGALRAALKDVRLELLDQRRELQRLKHGGPAVERVHESPALAAADPRVTIIVPLHNESACIARALDSCATQTLSALEIVAVDDGSTDGSSDVIRRWSEANAGVPLLLLRHPVNRGLGAARNTAIEHGRSPYVFVLDADNALFDVTLERLVEELERRPGAAFVYSMLAMEQNGVPVGLRSCFPWEPNRLRTGNYVDAMALWRTAALRDLGGYTTELRLHGWEDYDLFCRVAERGGHGALVPEILGRYSVRGHSMLSVTDISTRAAVSLLIERHPTVMRGVEPPL
ncbi:MAG TPA: glycosyltransferase family 2 protein [Solirubrobacteraceae bacterium]|jgi:hypothetical protein|nr:glycosyltransferase family 2 protein [Solirubrobacteraceae bacterium]